MAKLPDWLPPLVLLEDSEGDWGAYLERIYGYFKADFVDDKPKFGGRMLALKRHPVSRGKEATFWHMIQEGKTEEERRPNLRRCERIRWPKPIIENDSSEFIKIWSNVRRGETRICIWLESEEYVVILADRGDYILLWTAYPVVRNHTKVKFQREYEQFLRSEEGEG